MTKAAVVDTPTLLRLAKDGVKRDLNRQLDVAMLREFADPKGYHVLSPMIIHEHRAGEQYDPHLRCRALIKIKDQAEPERAIFDVMIGRYEELDKAPLVHAREGAER